MAFSHATLITQYRVGDDISINQLSNGVYASPTHSQPTQAKTINAGQTLGAGGNSSIVCTCYGYIGWSIRFLLPRVDLDRWGIIVVILLNSAVLVPFAFQKLKPRLIQFDQQYDRLCLSLKLNTWERWKIEWAFIRPALFQQLALSLCWLQAMLLYSPYLDLVIGAHFLGLSIA